MLNKEFCIPLEELVEELAQPMSTADIAELTIQLQIGKAIKSIEQCVREAKALDISYGEYVQRGLDKEDAR